MRSGLRMQTLVHEPNGQIPGCMQSRRAFSRFEVRIPGKLMWGNGAFAKDCVIQDLSEDGSRVDTMVFTEVPKKVELFESKTGDIFECVVRWQRNELIGLQFVDVCSRSKRRALIEQHALRVVAQASQDR
jgi:PilZ domain